jgi:putative membrane protein
MAAIDTATRLALDRTYLAHERTLMAWVRTATSLISFGFTIYKFFEFEAGRNLPAAGRLLSPRVFGMIMIATGLTALVLSTFDHRANMEKLRAEFGVAPRSVSLFVAAVVSILGVLAFVAALLQA